MSQKHRFPSVYLKSGREKPAARRHPWVFSGAIQRMDAVEPGGIVDVRAADGRFLARGYANSKSQITTRVLTFDESETIDAAFWQRRVEAAVQRRKAQAPLRHPDDNATRLVMSEADQLPGLIVDRYGDHLVLQALTAGIDRHLGSVVGALDAVLRPAGIYERSDDQVRELEGLPLVSRLLHGVEPPEGGVHVKENGLDYRVDLAGGHKTGFYLDQRQNHRYAQELIRAMTVTGDAPRVLDAFCYTGGFTLNALAGGAAHVLSLDASEPALARVAANVAANGFAEGRNERRCGDAFKVLREFREQQRSFDVIVLDPPKFAHHGGQIDKAARGYKDLNLLAFQLLRPGGVLLTFSCSGLVSSDLFQKIVFGAMNDAKAEAQLLQFLTQADDHPVLLSFPESLYLKGFACRKL
jgi:23S rRNA (cytosine1962-C5)-methyltransferase